MGEVHRVGLAEEALQGFHACEPTRKAWRQTERTGAGTNLDLVRIAHLQEQVAEFQHVGHPRAWQEERLVAEHMVKELEGGRAADR